MASQQTLALGLDSSTQSLSAVLVDLENGEVIYQTSLDYAKDERLNCYGINFSDYIIPPREPGEADQPPLMFLASLDALFADMKRDGVALGDITVINDSGQQHGHVYLGSNAESAFRLLTENESVEADLVTHLEKIFVYGASPIWKTSNTREQSAAIRDGVGGKKRMIQLSGSDSPLRFTGAVVRRVGQQFPELYKSTATLQLISSFFPAVLTANVGSPMDFGNGCGTSLMDYQGKRWSDDLIAAASKGLPGGEKGLRDKLPKLVSPDTVVGTVARYFSAKYGLNPLCCVAAGSGDNPQSKVLVEGDLLSLGTSFVNMVSTDGKTFDLDGYANGMYDGLGRPFMFGCRTNGALVWDNVRLLHGLDREDYGSADSTLARSPLGQNLFLWQPDNESFPSSPAFEPIRIGYQKADLAADYAGIIESNLALVYLYSKGFAATSQKPIFVTGGVTKVPEIMRRIASIWARPVITMGTVGAALGAAVAGASALAKHEKRRFNVEELSGSVLPRSAPLSPREEDVKSFHGENGYLKKLEKAYREILA